MVEINQLGGMMNSELQMVFVPGLSWILFALGGTQISDKVKGWKGWRRFILPAVYLSAVWIARYNPWQIAGVTALAIVVYSLPYGERTPWPVKFLVGCGYGLVSAPLGFSWWNAITAVGFIALFALSNTRMTSKTVPWKVCEGFFGLLVGVQISFQTMHH